MKNLTGRTFGKLSVIDFYGINPKSRQSVWKCKCSCGKIKNISSSPLIQGNTLSCGCLRQKKLENLIFGRLKVLKLHRTEKEKGRFWLCHCFCGKKCIVREKQLIAKSTKSCGCIKRELDSNRPKGKFSPKFKGFEEIHLTLFNDIKHGAIRRGLEFNITIEQIWDLFLKQNRKCALSGIELKFPKNATNKDKTASLDRIDSSKGYTVDNIQWVHKDINQMKMELPEEKFINYCYYICCYKQKC